MQGLVRREDGSVALQELPTPEPGPGQILVRTTLTTICGSDVHFVEDFPPRGRRASQRALGHEGVGVVEQVGDGVIRHSAGDRVVASCVQPCGTCEECLRGNSSLCERLRGGTGCLAEYFIVTNADVAATQIPDDLRDDEVIFAGDIMSTGFGAIENGEVALGDSVAIFAQGPVGLCATAGARLRGAALIIAIEGIPERREMAEHLGADIVIDPGAVDAVEEILRLTDGKGVDVAVEAVGLPETFRMATSVPRPGGCVSVCGIFAVPELSLPTHNPYAGPSHFRWQFNQFRLVTTRCPSGHHRLDQLMRLVRGRRVDLTPLFTHRLPLAQAGEAYDMFRHRRDGVIKIALTP